jgi:phosphoglycerol transferase MdoB-like AlkP superfamily enzyme
MRSSRSLTSTLPRLHGVTPSVPDDWRVSVAAAKDLDDLSSLHGAMVGRNVVFISLESTGARYLRCYGATEDPTPNLTRLAETSLVFEHAYAVTPESIKGLFCVLCSRYAAFDTRGEDYATVRTPSIAQRLVDAGYRAALFHSGRFMYLGMNAVVQGRGFDPVEDAGAIGGNFNSSFGVDEPATVERMLAWIDSLPPQQRFFIHYCPSRDTIRTPTPERVPFPTPMKPRNTSTHFITGTQRWEPFLDALRSRQPRHKHPLRHLRRSR